MTDLPYPTQAEIEAQILAARKARAETLGVLVRSAVHWLTHPRRALRHA